MDYGEAIVKRRPSRPQVHPEPLDEPHATAPRHGDEETTGAAGGVEAPVHYHGDAAEEVAPSRPTSKPSAVTAERRGEAEAESDDDDARSTSPTDEEEGAAAHDGLEEAATAPPPPRPMKTARPRDAKAKNSAKTEKAKRAKKEAETAPGAAAAAATATPAAPKKKKPTHRVNLANVEKQPPVAEGVNTPRSIAVCEKHGVNPAELAHYPKEHFKGAGVEDEVVELRYHSYEKRRKARMAELMPDYRAAVKHSTPRPLTPAEDVDANAPAAAQAEEEKEETQRTTTGPMDDEEKMRRQFEAQHQRLLEQERRKANGGSGGYDFDGYRRGSAGASYPRGTSPSRRSVSTAGLGRLTVDQPYSAVKIYSQSIAEERPLTQNEAVMIEEINEREAHRLDTQERAVIIRENKELIHVERELEKERRTTANVRAKAQERERIQYELFKHTNDRYQEAFARRQNLEEQRQAKLMESIAEKDGHAHSNGRYASLISRSRQSGSLTRRRSSNSDAQPQVQPTEEREGGANE
ncbi:hypothetical protein ABB37_10069 [Leptomonas pyrrhocoris]|uniref:Uncharacterized protein n=1 Tax=Leptomonas pyrrhocoris TaxID=157538 RepID=A0A0M9FP62_LEPPY|nr:hypothetical protein ABB37_10069 [Leptomonas pyrrhocoris]KPA73167.1 hypothetical protein ABB37_10069 [Leptomonas pyrrhocoris]|eukprot:XP_015651606.1 hypothetical protein ABB37_10069 [Leptomonas pyrrhocoris]